MRFGLCVLVQAMVLCVYTNITMSDSSHMTSSWEMSLNSLGLSSLYKLYKKCLLKDANKSIEECLSTQIVILTDQMVHQKRIPVIEGVVLVGKEESSGRSFSEERILTEETLEASLPRSLEARQGILDNLMLEKLSHFFKTHRLQVDLHSARAIKGMKINKLLLPFLMGVIMKIASIVPVILSIMGALALTALMAGKGALALAGLTALGKILHHGNHNGQNKGMHIVQQDMGASYVGHAFTNLVNSLGAVDHQQGSHGHGDSHSRVGHVLFGRSLKYAANDSVNTEKPSSVKVDTHASTTTEIPQYIQNFHYPGLTKTLVVTA